MLRSLLVFVLVALLQVHPLSVELSVLPPPGSKSSKALITVTFQYFVNLNLVGAYGSSSEDEAVLSNLFLGDNGDPGQFEVVLQAGKGQQLEFGAGKVKSRLYR